MPRPWAIGSQVRRNSLASRFSITETNETRKFYSVQTMPFPFQNLNPGQDTREQSNHETNTRTQLAGHEGTGFLFPFHCIWPWSMVGWAKYITYCVDLSSETASDTRSFTFAF